MAGQAVLSGAVPCAALLHPLQAFLACARPCCEAMVVFAMSCTVPLQLSHAMSDCS